MTLPSKYLLFFILVLIQTSTFAQNKINNTDGSITYKFGKFKSENYKNNEPTGLWSYTSTHKETKILDYNFNILYDTSKCPVLLKEYGGFEDIENIHYLAPTLAAPYKDIFDYIIHAIYYPLRASRENIMGKVFLKLEINEKGEIQYVAIQKGANQIIDKEAMRVIRELKFISPPLLDGIPISICTIFPIVFELSD
jgi:TonB family protein